MKMRMNIFRSLHCRHERLWKKGGNSRNSGMNLFIESHKFHHELFGGDPDLCCKEQGVYENERQDREDGMGSDVYRFTIRKHMNCLRKCLVQV